MIIHSVAPLSALLYNSENPEMKCVPYKGGYLEGTNSMDGFLVSRIISTNPADYLDKSVYPGACIKLP